MINERDLSKRFHAALDVEPPAGAFDRLATELARRRERRPPAQRNQWIVAVALVLLGVLVAVMIASRNATRVQPARHPGSVSRQPLIGGGLMAYDAGRRNTVLDSCSGQTWVWDGNQWTAQGAAPVEGAAPVGGCGDTWIAYDRTQARILLMIAEHSTTFAFRGTQTWTWDGRDWTQEHPHASLPLASSMVAMADDPAIGHVVLLRLMGYEMTTWLWNGHDWQQIAGAQPPAMAFTDHPPSWLPMAYDAKSHRLITLIPWAYIPYAFGDQALSVPAQDSLRALQADPQTWAFDGEIWRRVPAEPGEPKGGFYVMGTDVSGNLFLLGTDRETSERTFWSWSGSNWIRLKPPPFRNPGGAPAADPATGGLVITGTMDYGGRAPTEDETWVWDGRDWTRKACYLMDCS